MTPFYEHGDITIYLRDARDIVPHLSASTVLTDPPYGMNYKPQRGSDGSKRWGAETVTGDDSDFDPRWLLDGVRFPRLVLWGANHFSHMLPANPGWIVWDKVPLGRKEGLIAADVELAWTNCLTRPMKFSMQWGGEQRGGEEHWHPTQKPVALMDWTLRLLGQGTIFDPTWSRSRVGGREGARDESYWHRHRRAALRERSQAVESGSFSIHGGKGVKYKSQTKEETYAAIAQQRRHITVSFLASEKN